MKIRCEGSDSTGTYQASTTSSRQTCWKCSREFALGKNGLIRKHLRDASGIEIAAISAANEICDIAAI